MGWHVVTPAELEWEERPRSEGEAPRSHAPVTDAVALKQSRARMWRYAPGAKGKRHADPVQEEVFVVLSGRMAAYLGEPPERMELPAGSVLAVEPGTPLQLRNDSDEEARLFIYGAPPEQGGGAEFLPDAF